MSAVDGPRAVRRRRRIRWVVAGAVLVVLLGVGTGVVLTRRVTPTAAAAQGPAAVETAEVVRTDLAERRTETGKLGYGEEHTLTGRRPGTITALPAAGAVLDRGASVYQVDARPVPLFLGAVPLYRDLATGADAGPDVAVVEENLKALGFTGFGTPNSTFTAATATAIKKWQKSLGLDQTGTLGPADVVVAPGPLRVSTVTAELGAPGTGSVLTWTGTGRAVTVEVDPAYKDLAKPGTKVTLTMAGTSVPGTVTALAPTADSGEGTGRPGEEQEQTFTATIIPDDPAALGGSDAGSVDVRLTTGSREGVLAVPVGALLALSEGGYGVEIVEGDARRLVAVQTGLFADGMVEVTGADLEAGTRVVTTA
ncbi:MAG TPA: peptidoglycan-binding protein [Actinophytocola sp.]|uniref:peptidoglycan-binding protein n=1 Tax=Actinophytocola sp. TaxID=1872138 RepID=UPI002DBC250D|nr:peptidoglycan-binding protein [Actinophytocola sp.]HEU5475447.1 peptidoglycan-binding protein [Actinophytocola sp.]